MGLAGYHEINDALNAVLLGGRFEGRPLYLVLDRRSCEAMKRALRDTIGHRNLGEIENICCEAASAKLTDSGDPYARYEVEFLQWRMNGRKGPPPFTGLLYLLSHAAELMANDGEFSQSNYYDRLAHLTGIERGRLSFHGKSTEKFWTSFNNWLADTDYAYGRPTARAANGWKYVGLAMSQAIVREEDRHRFHDLFSKYGFKSTDAVTEEEIEHYIDSWIHTSKPTRQLKQAWKKSELRPRIAEAAVDELEDWKNETRGAQGGASIQRLSFALSFQQDIFSRSVAAWFGQEEEVQPQDVELPLGAGCLSNSTFGSFATLEPRSLIALEEALFDGLSLQAGAGQLTWNPRAVIPLRKSEQGNYWIEINRVSLGTEHAILAREEAKVRRPVEVALERVALPGYTVSTSRELKGLPRGWVLYENINVIHQVEDLEGYQAPLSAYGASSGIIFVGGLRIGNSIYHRDRPPTAVFDVRGKAVTLACFEGTADDGVLLKEETSEHGHVDLPLAAHVPESGNVFLQAKMSGKAASSASLLFRSSRRPRPLHRSKGELGHQNGYETVQLSDEIELARGLRCPGLPGVPLDVELQSFVELGRSDEGEQPPVDSVSSDSEVSKRISLANLSIEEVRNLPCEMRGFHAYKYETVPPDYPKTSPINKECTGCGIAVLDKRKAKAKAKQFGKTPANSVPRTAPVENQACDYPWDLWFDTACFWGCGPVSKFESLVASEELDPWRAGQVLRDLSLLGHLELSHDSSSRLRHWCVSPPVLSFVDDREAVLAGFRSPWLVEEIESLAEAAGGEVRHEAVSGQPDRISVHGLDHDKAIAAFDIAQDQHKRALSIEANASNNLVNFSIARGGLAGQFVPFSPGSSADLRRFDFEQMRWRPVDHCRDPGAYRAAFAGTSYFFKSRSGAAFKSRHELVKLAGAREAGVHLHAYDQADQTFVSVLGCEPSGLLGRALVACTGRLPTVSEGQTRYAGVPAEIARGVLHCLYRQELPS